MQDSIILKLDCPDRTGLVARLTGFFAELGGNLLEVQQFTDKIAGWFFTRIEVDAGSLSEELDGIRVRLAAEVADWNAHWTLRHTARRMRIVVLVSKIDHCLADLL